MADRTEGMARDDRRVVESLHEIGAALTAERDLDRLVEQVTVTAMVVTGATVAAFFHDVVEGEPYLLHTSSGGMAPCFVRVPLARGGERLAQVRAATAPRRLDDVNAEEDDGPPPPRVALPEGWPVRSYLGVPVVSRAGDAVGGLFLGHPAVAAFDERDERAVRALAAQAAVAIDNATLFRAAELARRAAERSAHRLAGLQAVTALQAAARTAADVAEVVVAHAGRVLGADAVVVCTLTPDGSEFELLHHAGLQPETVVQWRRFPVGAPVPAADAVRTGRPVLLRSLAERDESYPLFVGVPTAHHAFAIAPLQVEDRPLGALTLGWDDDRDFEEDDLRFLQAVADQCAQALERARLAAVERQAARRQVFLAEASRVLASSLDYEETLSRIGRLVVPAVADSCSIYLVDPGGLRLVAAANADPEREDLMRRLAAREGAYVTNPLLDSVARTGQTLFSTAVPDELWDQIADDAEHAAMLRSLGVHSGLAVPLQTPRGILGVLVVTRDQPGARLQAAEVETVEDLAGRAAVAIENARTHQERTAVARALQQNLLPPRLPEVPGLELACFYHPVGDGSEVGGDFYDVFPLAGGRWGVVIGDVSGKGARAASLTALARYTVRTACMRASGPSEVLRLLNHTILEHDAGERFCTIACVFVEVEAGGATVTVACGGHPLPLLVTTAGDVHPVGVPGTGIGLFPTPELADATVRLSSGDSLVLYTDGLVEARSPAGDFAPGLLEGCLAELHGAPARAVVDEVERCILDFQEGRPRDDMAMVVLRVP